jgi:hypothetical protein
MMNILRNLYRDFFGLNEVKYSVKKGDSAALTQAQKAAEGDPNAEIKFEELEPMVDEARLLNNITDYRGGVVYAIHDPAQAKEVSNDIRQWAEKKGFDVVKQTVSNDGRSGYFYFRLGRDPEKESQRIQGYFSSKLELKAFKFKVRGEQEQPAPETLQPTQPIPTKKPLRKI